MLNSFFGFIGIDVNDPDVREIAFYTLRNLLSRARGNGLIEDDSEVLERFDLERIKYGGRGIEFGENLLNGSTDKSLLFETSKRLLAEEMLRPELDRIYCGKSSAKAFGHPVHYILQADDRATRKELSRTLLQALYDNGRIKSRRYCYIDFKPGQDFSNSIYDALYKSCIEKLICRISLLNF